MQEFSSANLTEVLAEISTLSARQQFLVGLDVDGTLVDHDGNMFPEVKAALQAAASRGHVLVISTGRSFGATMPIAEMAGIHTGYAVCSNGGVTLQLDSSERGFTVIDRQVFNPAKALDTLEGVRPNIHFAVEAADGRMFTTPGFNDRSFGQDENVESSLEQMRDLEAVRVVVHAPDLSTAEFQRVISEAGLSGVSFAVGWSAWLEISGLGVTKAQALERVRQQLGIPSENTISIGDGRNDIDMLKWANYGFAMGQADAEVRSAARAVTKNVQNHGAALVLDSLQVLH